MKRLVFLLLLVMPFVQIYGQYKVSGVVKGEDSAPLQGVVITAYNNNKLLKYTVSGVSGSYALNINAWCFVGKCESSMAGEPWRGKEKIIKNSVKIQLIHCSIKSNRIQQIIKKIL